MLAPNQRAWSAMQASERLSALIGAIYDAALDPESWIDVLDQTL
jgi:hypothetical protein